MKTLKLTLALVAALWPARSLVAQTPGWLGSSWAYRTQITLGNPNGASLEDFQVHVRLDSSFSFDKAKPDGSDIRLTASDGTTVLPHWVETWNLASLSASIWVKVPSLPANGAIVYLYYGNPLASSISKGDATFEFFDDFEASPHPLEGYFHLGPPQTALVRDQSWETAAPHTLSVLDVSSGGHTYWGYYGLDGGCGGVGLAFSDDLVSWTKYTGNPVFSNGRWPSVLRVNGTFYMLYTKDYCTTSYIVLATSADGITFTDVKTIVEPQLGFRNQNPNLFYNQVDGLYYIYWYSGDGEKQCNIKARRATSPLGLDDGSTETTLLSSSTALAAPNMLYYGGTYFLSTEVLDGGASMTSGSWNVMVYASTDPMTGFIPLPGNPVISNNSACMFQHVFGNTLHEYTCKLDSGTWTLEHRAADLSLGRILGPDTAKWAPSSGSWLPRQDVQQDGLLGTVIQGSTLSRQVLQATGFQGRDYVVEAYGKQVSGRVWGLGVGVTGPSSYDSANLYEDLDGTDNLYAFSFVRNPAATLGNASVGVVNPNEWYKLTAKVHGTWIELYKDDVLQVQASDSSLTAGGVALYGEANTVANFNNVLVRKYAAVEPTATITGRSDQLLSGISFNPNPVFGGDQAVGSVTLASVAPAGGIVVTLSSSNPTIAGVPVSVVVNQGATSASFMVRTSTVVRTSMATISATYSGQVQQATLTVTPILSSVVLSPSSVFGGGSSVGTVTLAASAPQDGAVISLSSSNPAVASVPNSVTVQGGAVTAGFTVTSGAVSQATSVTITATYAGASQAAVLMITPVLSSLTFTPAAVMAGGSSVGMVLLSGAAPAGGVVVVISSSSSSVAAVPNSVTVPAGATSATFTVTTNSVSQSTNVTITASYDGINVAATLPVNVVGGSWLNPSWVYRSAVAVANGSGAALMNHQVQVKLDASFDFTKVRSDGADLRFADADGGTQLPYWIESWNPSQQSARLWVRVPTIPTSGVTLFLYYGNSSANSSTASGDQTFEFFDDFSSAILNPAKWSASGGTWSVVSDTQQDGIAGLVGQGSTTATQILSSLYSGTDYVVQVYGKQVAGRLWGLGVRNSGVGNLYSANLYDDLNSTNNLYLYRWMNNSAATLGSASVGVVNPNEWYKLTAKVHGTWIELYKDDVLQVQASDSSLTAGGVALYGEANTVANFNNVLVRKYAAVEPTATITGRSDQLLSGISFNPNPVFGGDQAVGSVTLASVAPAGGIVVTLSSSNPTIAGVPVSVVVNQGATSASFMVRTSTVVRTSMATISATYSGQVQQATLTVTPILSSVVLSPSSVFGGGSSVGTVTLAASAPQDGAVISLSSSNPAVASVPNSVTVQGGAVTAGFTVTSGAVSQATSVTITATYAGASQAAVLMITPVLSSLTFTPAAVMAGGSSVGMVLLSGAAPAGGVVVVISSSSSSVAAVPNSVTVPAGATSATFTVTTNSVSQSTNVTITASYDGINVAATLPVNVVGGSWLNPSWVYRSAVAVANGSGAALMNHQVQVKLDASFDFTKVRSDGADLRFADADGGTQLPYWIESWNPSQQSARLWVRVPTIPTSGVTLFLYYGNSSANSSTASGDQTFEFFDDFSSAILNPAKWSASGGTWSVVSDTQQDGIAGLVGQGSTTATQILSSLYSGTDYVVQVYGKQVAGRLWGLGVRNGGVGNLYSANLYDDLNSTNNLYLYRWMNNSAATLGSASVGVVNPNEWYKLTAKVHGTWIELYKDDVLQVQASDSSLTAGGVALYGEANTVANFNNVLVRKYAAVEPTATVGGTVVQAGFGVASVALVPSTVAGGTDSIGTVTLTAPAPAGGAVVTLTSSEAATAAVPGSVIVAAGASTAIFTVATNPVVAVSGVTVSATLNGVIKDASLTVNPPSLSAIALTPSIVAAGGDSGGTVTLTGPASTGGAVVALTSSNPAVAAVPASVTVSPSSSTASFTVNTGTVAYATGVVITATYNGTSQQAALTVMPTGVSLSVNPTSVKASQSGMSLTFTFFTTTAFTSGSRVRITVPSGWTVPNTSNVGVTNTNCTSAGLGSVYSNVITVNMVCPANTSFRVTFGTAGNYVTSPDSAQNSTFSATTRLGYGNDTAMPTSPVVAILGSASRIAFTTQPGGGTAGLAWTLQPVLAIQDSFGHTIADATNAITLAIGTNPGSGTLSCITNPLDGSAGAAMFAGCSINKSGNGYTLTASAAGLAGATSGTFNIAAGAAAQLVFTQEPGGGTGGTTWAAQPRVTVQDSNGNTVTTPAYSITLATGTNPSSGSLGCTANPVSTSSGVAIFAGCAIDRAGSGYTLLATSGSLHGATSAAFSITVGSAAKLGFTIQPSGGMFLTAWPAQPVVAIQDAGGNTVTTVNRTITLAISNNPGSGTLACPPGGLAMATVSGVATFAGCNISKSGIGYTLSAASSGMTSATTSAFNITAGAATKLVFTMQPGNGSGGSSLATQPVVAIEDANGNIVNTDASSVTLTISNNPGGGTLTCAADPVTAMVGVATFSGCQIDRIGNGYRLQAIDGTLAPATSNTFNITVGSAAKLAFTTQPGGGTGGATWLTQPVVAVQDAGGNTVTNNYSSVTLAISTNPGGGTLNCTSNPRSAVSGVATFTGCAIDKIGTGYTLRATDGSLTATTSNAFTVTVGLPTQLTFTTQPSGGSAAATWGVQPVVAIQDAGGNTVSTASRTVTLAISTNPGSGTLVCSPGGLAVATVSGVATFAGCSINRSGTGYILSANASGVSSDASSAFNIVPGPATRLVFTTQPGNGAGGASLSTQPVVTISDANGNTVTTDTSTVTLAISSNPGGGTLMCPSNPRSAVSGVATFTGCAIDKIGAGYTLRATDGSLTAATSNAFNIAVGPAAKLGTC